jgi:hypothetical protein
VIVPYGELSDLTARRLEALAESLIVTGESALAIDCTTASGLTGHPLGTLRRVAATAADHGVAVGVAVESPAGGDVIPRHTPSVLTAPTSASVLDSLGSDREAPRIALVTRSRSANRASS